jgi:hypothetical protein
VQQWNANWSDKILKKMAAILADWDIIYLTKVSSTAPIEEFCKTYLTSHTAEKLVPLLTKAECTSKDRPKKYGAVLFNSAKFKGELVLVEDIVSKNDLDNFDKYPFMFLFETINDAFETIKTPHKFLISGIHGSTGLSSSSKANNFYR